MDLAARLNAPERSGQRLLPVPGEVFSKIDAIRLLTGAQAELVAGGGVCGAEGSIWLHLQGSDEQMQAAERLKREIAVEP